MKYILISGLFLSLVLVYGPEFGNMPYVVLLLCMSLIIVGYLINFSKGYPIRVRLNFSNSDFSPFDRFLSYTLIWLWLLIVASWFIGAWVGIVNNVIPSFVFRNFFGLLVYLIFPVILIVSPSVKSLINVIFLSGVVQMFYGFEKSYGFIINPAAFYTELSFSGMRSFYNTGFIVIFPLFIVGVVRHLLPIHYFSNGINNSNNNSRVVSILSNSLIFTLLALIALVVPAMSKGYILSTAMLFLSVVFCSIMYSLRSGRIHKNVLILLIFLVVLLYLLPNSFFDTIIHTYSLEEKSNAIKSEEYRYLVAELSFFGNGLGSSLISGYVVSTESYGFELTYVNIVHKLGVFSIFLFLSYVETLIVASIRIVKRMYVFESFFVIGLMGYLVVGAGNPILLSPSAVVLHCIAMYILVKPFLRSFCKNHVESPYQQ